MQILSGISSSEAFSLGKCYAQRSMIISGPDTKFNQRQAQSMARHYLELCIALRNRDRQWATQPDQDILRAELVLANVYRDDFSDETTASLRHRIQTIHLAIRAYIDYFWTLMVYKVDLPLPLVVLLAEILPNGFEGSFDLSSLQASRGLKRLQKHVKDTQVQLKPEVKHLQRRRELPVEAYLQLMGSHEPLRASIVEAVTGIDRCIHEVIVFLTTLKVKSGYKQLCQAEESGRPRIDLAQERDRLTSLAGGSRRGSIKQEDSDDD